MIFFLYTHIVLRFCLCVLRTLRLFKLSKDRSPSKINGNPHLKVTELKSKFSLNLNQLNLALRNLPQELRIQAKLNLYIKYCLKEHLWQTINLQNETVCFCCDNCLKVLITQAQTDSFPSSFYFFIASDRNACFFVSSLMAHKAILLKSLLSHFLVWVFHLKRVGGVGQSVEKKT